MSYPKNKIAAGLDAREREKNSNVIPLEILAGAPSSVAHLQAMAESLTAKRDKLVGIVANTAKHITDHRTKKQADFAEVGIISEETGGGLSMRTDTLGDDKRRALLEDEAKRFTKEIHKTTEKDRASLYREIRDGAAKVRATRDSLSDPVAVLMRETRLDTDRATATAILAHSGPREVEAALQDAVLTKNKALAAAAFSRMDAMPKSARDSIRHSRNEVAEEVIGDETVKAKRFLAMLDIAEIDSDIAWAESEGRDVARLVVRRGLKQRELGHLLKEDSNDNEGES